MALIPLVLIQANVDTLALLWFEDECRCHPAIARSASKKKLDSPNSMAFSAGPDGGSANNHLTWRCRQLGARLLRGGCVPFFWTAPDGRVPPKPGPRAVGNLWAGERGWLDLDIVLAIFADTSVGPIIPGEFLDRPGTARILAERACARSRGPGPLAQWDANVRRPLWAQHNFAPGVPLFQDAIGLPDLVKREHLGDRNV
jgi:hypothetical protein